MCVLFWQVEENLGMVMVFTIISALQEKLTVLVEDMKQDAQEKRLKKVKAEEEAAQVRMLYQMLDDLVMI